MSKKKKKTARRPERSKGELSSDDLDSVAGGAPSGGGGGGDALPTESLSFNYSKIEMKWLPADSSGAVSGQVPVGYPLAPKKK